MAGAESIGYGALLKPIHDHLLKNWSLALTLILDDFMSHVEEQVEMNFSEAAMLLQNSTTFYCKRVDVVYKIMQELVVEVSNLKYNCGNDDEEGSKKSGPLKKKKAIKSLEMDDLELLDFVASDHSIDMKESKIDLEWIPKQIVLSSSLKAIRKAGTSVTVYEANGKVLGCKEEFRIFGRMYSDGTVNEDLNFDEGNFLMVVDETNQMDDSDNHDGGMDVHHDDIDVDDVRDATVFNPERMAGCLPPEMLHEITTEIPVATTSIHLPVESRVAEVKKRPTKRESGWEPVPHDYKYLVNPLKVANCFSIPEDVLQRKTEMAEQLVQITGKRKKKRMNRNENDAEQGVKIIWIDQIIGAGSARVIERLLEQELQKRKKLLSSYQRPDVFVEPADEMGSVHEDDPNDFENFQDDEELAAGTTPTRADDIVPADQSFGYVDEAASVMNKFKVQRKETALRATEAAARVAAWHDSLMPILMAAEARSQFDVHEYGTSILEQFPDDDHETFRPFKDVVTKKEKNEVSRYFLASLMLANTYNLDIKKNSSEHLAKDCMELRLISKVRHHEEMDEALRITSEVCGT